MDEISKINIFGHQAAGKINKDLAEKKETKKEVDEKSTEKSVVNNNQKSSEEVLNAMNLAGLLNKAQMGVSSINPRDYLSEERIKDIEDSMQVFDSGVEKYAKTVRQEFGSLSEQTVYELAAKSFSLEV